MLGLSGTSQYAVYVYLCILLLYLSFSLYLSSPYDRRDHPLYGNISNEVSDMILGCWGGCLQCTLLQKYDFFQIEKYEIS